jgi:dihydrofolate reductase
MNHTHTLKRRWRCNKMELIVAITDNFVIGANGVMPWHLPADLQHFKKITSGHAIAMGRRTWDSIGKPLPNRLNIVITRQAEYKAVGATVVHSLEDAKQIAEERKLFVIGGGEIYRSAMEDVSLMHITRIHTTIDGDTFFPKLDELVWERISALQRPADENNSHDLSFEVWSKR